MGNNLSLTDANELCDYAKYLTSSIRSIGDYNRKFTSLYELFNTSTVNNLESIYLKMLGVEDIKDFNFS